MLKLEVKQGIRKHGEYVRVDVMAERRRTMSGGRQLAAGVVRPAKENKE